MKTKRPLKRVSAQNRTRLAVTSPDGVTVSFHPGPHPLTAAAAADQGVATPSAIVTVSVRTVAIPDRIAERIAKGDILIELQTVADGMAAPPGLMTHPNFAQNALLLLRIACGPGPISFTCSAFRDRPSALATCSSPSGKGQGEGKPHVRLDG